VPSTIRTLEEERDERGVRRARNARRVGLTVILLLVVGGLAGLMGIRSATATASGGGSILAVTHAQVTRAGIATPLHIEVRRAGGFDGPISLAISASLLERFDFQNFYPNPSKETADGQWLRYEFDPPPGTTFRLSLDARTAPDQNGSIGRYEVRLLDRQAVITRVTFRMVVVP
jgi:hypothetical protein